jgi:hypothetical protein
MNQNKIPSINTLHNEKKTKETFKNDIYNIVLNKIIEKIIYTNRHTDKTYVIFEVPKILIGYPQYEMKSCILFLITKLSASGYITEFMEPFYLYIDWGTKDTNCAIYIPSVIKTKNHDKLKAQTKALLTQFPNTSQVEFVYEDTLLKNGRGDKTGKGGKQKDKRDKKDKRKK